MYIAFLFLFEVKRICVFSTLGGPFRQRLQYPTIVEATSTCIVESFARFPLPGYLFLESQLLKYTTGIFCAHKPSSSALLFEEGPINDYQEDMVLCNLWCEALQKLCTSHNSKEVISSQMSQLYTVCIENLVRIAERYLLKPGSSTLPPLFSKEGSLLLLSLYTNLNILHFLCESGKVVEKDGASQWSTVDLCKDTLTQYCCFPHEGMYFPY